jgi:aconitate hydratase
MTRSVDSFHTRTAVVLAGKSVDIFSLRHLEEAGYAGVARLPYSLKILLENLLRHEDGSAVSADDIRTLANWSPSAGGQKEIAFTPARVLLQDFTGVPCVVDLAAMRDGIARLGGDPGRVNPLQPVELVIDHSVQVDYFGRPDAARLNADLEFVRNKERYQFLRWGQQAFRNFKAVPPDTGIVHQVNLEYLARVVFSERRGSKTLAYPDTVVGTDSHTTMVNGLGVVGWGVGGIEAEAAMLGQPISMLIPEVIGLRLTGRMPEGTTATDVVLAVTERLRKEGVVGRFVEFCGTGLRHLTLADRATLSNMCPEYGATVAIFPIDEMTIEYLKLTGRDPKLVGLVEEYAKAQGIFAVAGAPEASYARTIDFDLSGIEPCLAGPRRPHDRVSLKHAREVFERALPSLVATQKPASTSQASAAASSSPQEGLVGVGHGSVVVASITSCTNTSNPSVMIGAGLLAKKAVARGLQVKPWVKTSLAPGSKAVTAYLDKAGLTPFLDQLGFHLVGYGCATCIGNSGPLPEGVASAVKAGGLVVASVLSGNRNFEGRIQPLVRANYLASPLLVVAYALAGTMLVDLTREPLGRDAAGRDVFLGEIWPTESEIEEAMVASVSADAFRSAYSKVFKGDEHWRSLEVPAGDRYGWDPESTYIRHPPFFEHLTLTPAPVTDVAGARVLAMLGDSVTTDHISPAGSIPADGPAGRYLVAKGVAVRDFNSFGARRGNHEVMMRGTFANIRLRNQLVSGVEGGWTVHLPDGDQMSIYDAAMRYEEEGVPLIVLAGKEYGSGSSRDWAAKGTALLGVRAVLAESFERIHRSNLVNMGVLPLQFKSGQNAASLMLTGRETFSIAGIARGLKPGGDVTVRAQGDDGSIGEFYATARIDTPEELVAFNHGGILPYVLRQLVGK